MTMTRGRRHASLIACAYLCWAGSARADAVADWNVITTQAVAAAVPPRPGPAIVHDFAIVHVAVYDAVQAIEKDFEPYAVEIPGAGGSPAAATARAAHDVLVGLFPEQSAALDTTYRDYLASHGLAENDPGVAVGQEAAAGILALRAGDGRYPDPPPPPFVGGTGRGVWRPTTSYLPGPPPSNSPMTATWLATVTPFTLTDPTQFRPGPPPRLSSARYVRDYKEVKALGRDVGSARTPQQTATATFWLSNFGVVWNVLMRDLAASRLHSISDSSRLFALVNMAGADAAVTAWDSKLHFVYWRPVTAIQEGNRDGNPRTDGDPEWRPFANTPPYPDYTSGANIITASMTRSIALFFGTDRIRFTVTSTNPAATPPTRTYRRLSDAAQDVVDARVYQGIHFRTADTTARAQGIRIARWAFRHFLRPVDFDDDDHGDASLDEGIED
jgi:PAP2 superfamily